MLWEIDSQFIGTLFKPCSCVYWWYSISLLASPDNILWPLTFSDLYRAHINSTSKCNLVQKGRHAFHDLAKSMMTHLYVCV